MRIVFASGKGGAGKTTVTASLAALWPRPIIAADCDVEAPNLHLFLAPDLPERTNITLDVPVLNAEKCTACGACKDICQYRAIARFGRKVLIFPDMCHGCGGCFAVCPEGALNTGERELGALEEGTFSAAGTRGRFIMGRTRIGEAMTPPLLRALLARLENMTAQAGEDALIDSPPGVSCPAMTVAGRADMVVLVAEPTPFGFHDFKLAHAAFARTGAKLAVVMNRSGMEGNEAGDTALRAWCAERHLPLLAELPFDRAAAEQYAGGGLIAQTSSLWEERFRALAESLLQRAEQGGRHA